ncbi:MAG TPA: FHA domain-containing protein, partial [Ktedonobacteraceae bacterium]|nr:FHA domain-containing protein [Ktedonobacteraceae bacterium]
MNAVNTSPDSGSIRFLTGPLAGKTFQISKAITTIGREATNDIVVKGDPKVSRTHARLIWNNGNWSIEKIATQNILTINQQPIQQLAPIYNNTSIGLGEETSFVFLLRNDVASATPTPPMSQPYPQVNQPAQTPQRPFSPPMQPQQGFPQPQSPQYPASGPHPIQQQSFQTQPPAQPWFPQTVPPSQTPPGTVFSQQQYAPSYPQPYITGPVGRPDETVIAPLASIGIPFIEVSSNTIGVKQNYQLTKDVTNFGRDATNDIVINDRIISGQHLQIVRQGNQFTLIHPHPDKQRTLNGLLYQGRKINGMEPFRKTLVNGDIFRIGDEHGTLVTLVFNDGTGTQQEALAPVRPIKLGSPEITIGRRPDNTVVLSHPQVSGLHARMVREGGTYRIIDQNSTNHVYV